MTGTNGHNQQTLEYRDAREIPHDEEPPRRVPEAASAEQALLGAVLIDNDVMLELRNRIERRDFVTVSHGWVWQAMADLWDQKRPIDYVTVVEHLAEIRRKEGVDIGGAVGIDNLAAFAEFVPTSANALQYAYAVRDARQRRDLMHLGAELQQSGNQSVEDTVARVNEVVRAIEDRESEAHPSMTVRTVMVEVFRKLDEFGQRPAGALPGLASGFIELDELTGGFRPGELIILAARPSIGKTTCASSMIRHIAINEGRNALFFSCEMNGEQIVQNMLCAEARINTMRLRRGYLDDYEYNRLVDASERLREAPAIINDTPNVTLSTIRTVAKRAAHNGKLDVLFVDYLQILGTRGLPVTRKDGREREVAALSQGLKGLARELEVPTIVLAQLNRDVEKRGGNHKPRMSDLRESGSIENDADVILLLHREHYYTRNDEDREKAELLVAKQRNGPTGTAHLRFRAEYMRFDNPDDDDQPRAKPAAQFRESRPAGTNGLGANQAAVATREYDEDEAPFDYDDHDAPPLV